MVAEEAVAAAVDIMVQRLFIFRLLRCVGFCWRTYVVTSSSRGVIYLELTVDRQVLPSVRPSVRPSWTFRWYLSFCIWESWSFGRTVCAVSVCNAGSRHFHFPNGISVMRLFLKNSEESLQIILCVRPPVGYSLDIISEFAKSHCHCGTAFSFSLLG